MSVLTDTLRDAALSLQRVVDNPSDPNARAEAQRVAGAAAKLLEGDTLRDWDHIYLCPTCGGDDLQMTAWVWMNEAGHTGDPTCDPPDDEVHCPDCEQDTSSFCCVDTNGWCSMHDQMYAECYAEQEEDRKAINENFERRIW